jgi:hypothetical protein
MSKTKAFLFAGSLFNALIFLQTPHHSVWAFICGAISPIALFGALTIKE